MSFFEQPDASVGTVLVHWYRLHQRNLPWRHDVNPYRVWVSEIMLQQTRVEAVKPYFNRFVTELPTPADLAAADDDRLVKLWEGLGYYSRVRNMKKCAEVLVRDFGGNLPSDVAVLRTLPGIGSYTAGAIASIAFGIPAPAVDGNVLRVLSRLTDSHADIMKTNVRKEAELVTEKMIPAGDAAAFTQSLFELGATVCLPGKECRCDICPVSVFCKAKENATAWELPVKTPKAARRIEERTVFLLEKEGCFAIVKRPAKGLLAGLWEYPNRTGHLTEKEIDGYLSPFGLTAESVEVLPDAVHVFTHIEWHMSGFHVRVTGNGDGLVFAAPQDFLSVYAVPSAFSVYTKCRQNIRGSLYENVKTIVFRD